MLFPDLMLAMQKVEDFVLQIGAFPDPHSRAAPTNSSVVCRAEGRRFESQCVELPDRHFTTQRRSLGDELPAMLATSI